MWCTFKCRPCWMAGAFRRKHVFVNLQTPAHSAFQSKSSSWLSNHQWLGSNSSLKHHHNFSTECLIVARHANLGVACVLAVTLGLFSPSLPPSPSLFLPFSFFLSLPLSRSVLCLLVCCRHMGKFFKLIAPIWLGGSYVAGIYWYPCEPTSSC